MTRTLDEQIDVAHAPDAGTVEADGGSIVREQIDAATLALRVAAAAGGGRDDD